MNSATQAFYIGFQATFANVRANMQTFLISIVTIAISIGILEVFLIIFFNLNGFLSSWNQQVQLIVYLDDDISPNQKNILEALFKGSSNIKLTEEINKEKAWRDFKLGHTGKSGLDLNIGFNPLPSSYKVSFKMSDDRLAHISEFAEKVQKESGVESVEYGENWIAHFEKFMVFCRIFLIATGALLSFGLILIISNTIRLSIYSRQEEIELMLLIGATPSFVKVPFLLEGILQGLCGSLLSLGIMSINYYYLKSEFQVSIESITSGVDFQFISLPFLFSLVGLSVFIGFFASYISTYQYMQVLNKR